ncbi:MAG TPA: hypothetical protein VHB50_03250 [Bryobacteraceae bacterium]|nr:hypothetical protein [Bryobacteraceae bacterium]
MEGTASDGKPAAVHYMVPMKGGKGKMMNTAYDAISAKRISANERENTFSKGGKVAFTAHSTIAPDGKTMTVATKGTNPAGQDTDGTVTYEKQ